MSSRTYLSIGDVLTLLREEFPDVTISKIRFLESQGLVNPERSPSGYRKFFDHDVERLRWVLRQQREHFLPLKVIRDRLAGGDIEDSDVDASNGKPVRHATVRAGSTATALATVQVGEDEATKADQEAMARILADASRRAARRPEEPQGRPGQVITGGDPTESRAGAQGSDRSISDTTGVSLARPGGAVDERGTDGGGARESGSAEGLAPEPVGAAPSGPAAESEDRGAAVSNAEAAPATGGSKGGGRDTRATEGSVSGASLTLEELCATSGLSADEVAGLQSFGLIEAVPVAGIATFEEDALTVANLAASFRVYGIEPRHLRLYRNAVDRELGLIEQVVIPLLRQRNPESRQRAVDGADELASLGESMRSTLLRQALRRHLGG